MRPVAHALVGPDGVWRAWPFDPLVSLGVVSATVVYAVGHRRLSRAGRRSVRRVIAFYAGTVALAVALLSPLDPLAQTLFSAHMAQHLLLMVVAAPLLVVARPVATSLAAVPAAPRRSAARTAAAIAPARRASRRPLVALGFLTVATWSWHAPTLYDTAVASEPLHALEHTSFLLASMLAWSVALRSARGDVSNAMGRALLLVACALQGALLGALLVFASTPLYSAHRGGPAVWGLTALEDQQLAGALMWIPPSAVYLSVVAAVLIGAFRGMERRAEDPEVNAGRDGVDVPAVRLT